MISRLSAFQVEEVLVVGGHPAGLADCYRGASASRYLADGVHVVHHYRILDPQRIERLKCTRDAGRHRTVPHAVQLRHDLHLVADSTADFLEGFKRLLQIGG
jgi:hypothetical protein